MIYLIESDNYYKVGYTKDWKERERAYNTHNPDFKLIGLKDGDKRVETQLHQLLSAYKYKLEWFIKCKEVLSIWKNYFKYDEYSCIQKPANNVLEDSELLEPITQFYLNDLDYHVVTLPNKMTENSELEPKDLVIYLAIKRFDNPQHECFPSLHKICEKSGASINTVRKCIKNLIDAGYITTEKKMNRTYYYFDPYKKYECFTFEFLDNPNLSFIEKSYLIADQQYMYINSENCGIITYTNREESKLTKIPYRTLMRINKSLKEKNYLQIVDTSAIDLETGCNKDVKVFNLKAMGQNIINPFKKHEDLIQESTRNLQTLKESSNKIQEEHLQLKETQDFIFAEIDKLKELINKKHYE